MQTRLSQQFLTDNLHHECELFAGVHLEVDTFRHQCVDQHLEVSLLHVNVSAAYEIELEVSQCTIHALDVQDLSAQLE